MALPVTISGVVFPTNNGNGRMGPFLSGGNFYVVFVDSTDGAAIDVFKATDPTDSWSQSQTSSPDANDVQHMAVHQEGTDLHIAALTTDELVFYGVYSMSSETFTTAMAKITDAGPADAISDDDDADQTCDISVRSDGDVIIVYSGDEDNDKGAKNRVDYARLEGGTWTVDIAVDDGGAFNHEAPAMVRGESDLMAIIWHNATGNDLLYKNLNSSNTLSSVIDISDLSFGTPATNIRSHARMVYYDDGGIERITVVYHRGSGNLPQSLTIDDQADPTGIDLISGSNIVTVTNDTSKITAALDGKTVHVLWADVNLDLFHDQNTDDAGWGTDVELLDAVTINAISANVYTRGPYTVLAVVYDNGGTITYNEFPLSYTPTKLSDTAFSDQNYYHGPFEI